MLSQSYIKLHWGQKGFYEINLELGCVKMHIGLIVNWDPLDFPILMIYSFSKLYNADFSMNSFWLLKKDALIYTSY